jgi:hypothetical protein
MVCEMAESAREDESGGSDEYEYVTLTSAEVLEKLEEAWQNERFAPELLEHKTEVVDCILEQIKEMEENLSHVGRGDFVAGIHRLEVGVSYSSAPWGVASLTVCIYPWLPHSWTEFSMSSGAIYELDWRRLRDMYCMSWSRRLMAAVHHDFLLRSLSLPRSEFSCLLLAE